MTTSRPVSGWTANWMLQPPVSTPTARSTSMPTSRMCWYSRSVSVIAGATVTESPVCTPIGSMFSIEQTTTTLSLRSRISSSSYSFQPSTLSSISTSVHRALGEPGRRPAAPAPPCVCAMPEPRPPMVNDGRITTGRPRSSTVVADLVHRVADRGCAGVSAPTCAHDVLEPLPVLAALDGLDVGADQLDAVLLQHAALVQRDRACSARSARRAWPAARPGARSRSPSRRSRR